LVILLVWGGHVGVWGLVLAGKGAVARLAEAVLALEEALEQVQGEARGYANDIVRLGDLLARELANDIDVVVKMISDEVAREVENIARGVEAEYEERIRVEVERAERLGRENLEAAVEAIVEELKRIVGGV